MDQAIETVGFDIRALWITFGTLIALGAIALLVMQVIKIFRELRNPSVMSEKSIRDKLHHDHERLSVLEMHGERQEEELKLLLRSQLVMVHHMIDGNSVENLKGMLRQIENYLIYGTVEE